MEGWTLMDRAEAYKLIDAERTAQDEVWRTGRANEEQYKFSAPHVLLLVENMRKLPTIWYGTKDEGSLQERFVKIAAIAVRALEEIKVT
jgi:hypothetical protein